MTKLGFPPEQEAEIIRRYQAGESATRIANSFGKTSGRSVQLVLEQHGVQWRPWDTSQQRHVLRAEEEAEIIARYQAGESVRMLARGYMCRTDAITAILDAQGLIARSRGGKGRTAYPPEQEAEIIARYQAGESADALVGAFGGSRPSIFKALKRNGIAKRRMGRPTWRMFTPEQAQEMGRLWHEGLSQTAIAKRFGTAQVVVSRVLIEHGIQPVARYSRHGTLPIRLRSRRGNQSSMWKGGRTLTAEGYVLVKIQPDHPFASMRNVSGYMLEHRLVMAEALGRPLRKDETVHHKNGQHDDNRLENLQLRNGQHGTGIVVVCGDCGSHNITAAPLASIS